MGFPIRYFNFNQFQILQSRPLFEVKALMLLCFAPSRSRYGILSKLIGWVAGPHLLGEVEASSSPAKKYDFLWLINQSALSGARNLLRKKGRGHSNFTVHEAKSRLLGTGDDNLMHIFHRFMNLKEWSKANLRLFGRKKGFFFPKFYKIGESKEVLFCNLCHAPDRLLWGN
jgi:hypothetical protein